MEEGKNPRARKIIGLLVFLVFGTGLCSFSLLADAGFSREDSFILMSLHSAVRADYSVDGGEYWMHAAEINLIEFAIRDRDPDAPDASERFFEVVRGFETPVPTVTPGNLWLVAPGEDNPPPSVDIAPSSTLPHANTPDFSPTIPGTLGPSPTPMYTATYGPSPIVSFTPTVAKTQPIIPTGTADTTQLPTSTASLPPPTSSPTITSSPLLTSTPDSCAGISISGFSNNGQQITWSVTNGSTQDITISMIYLNWPSANDELVKVELDGDAIWDRADDTPPTVISSGWKSGVSRMIASGQSRPLMFQFDKNAASAGYSLQVTFDNGCQSSAF